MKKLFLAIILAFSLGCDGLYDSGENFFETGFDNIRAKKSKNYKLILDKNQYEISENINITYFNLPGNSTDWIGLYETGADHEEYLVYQYTDGQKNGTMTFEGLDKKGKYEARLYFKDSYKMKYSVIFMVDDGDPPPTNNPQFKLNKSVYMINEQIVVTYSDLPGNILDWIGLFNKNSTNQDYIVRKYTGIQKEGRIIFEGLDAGNYEARLFFNNSYTMEHKVMFTVMGDNSPIINFIAYGDSRTNSSVHKSICTQMNSENPELIIHVGDLWDGYSSSTWRKHFTSNSNLYKLLINNKILVARGNHESSSEVKKFSPSIIKNGSLTYSFLQGNVFFVCLGEDPSASYLERQLQKSVAQNADFRVIFHHRPIYSAGDHGASGISSVEKICDKYNVTFSFAGHDHNYERSKVIYNRRSSYSGNNVPANVKGTTYIVTGGAGAPLYSVGSKWWTDKRDKTYHYCVLSSYNDRIEMVVKDRSGYVLERFTRKK